MSDTAPQPLHPHLVAALAESAGLTPRRMFAALRAERALIDSGTEIGPRPMFVLGTDDDPPHGPRELLPADRRDCGCGWGDLCDAQPHGICACTPYRNITRQDWRRIVDTTC